MGTEYFTEDGHVFEDDDLILYIKIKIVDLRSKGYSDQKILYFDDNDMWFYYCDIFLKNDDWKYYIEFKDERGI